MKRYRWFIYVAIALAAFLFLTAQEDGCSSDDEDTGETPAATTEATPATTGEEAEEVEDEGVEVTEPSPEPTPEPSPEPVGPATSIGDGTFVVGEDIAAGTYTAAGSSFCYWERLSGFSGDLDDIIANGATAIRQIVTISPGDMGFTSNGCGTWTQDLSPFTSDPAAPFGDGMYQVGVDIAAGTWRSDGASDSCYWARLSSFSNDLDNILANDIGGGQHIVAIAPGDVGFEASDCGTWTKID